MHLVENIVLMIYAAFNNIFYILFLPKHNDVL